MVLPSDYASDSVPVQQLIITDEERGDRGLPQFSGLDASLNTAALTGAQSNADPPPPLRLPVRTAGDRSSPQDVHAPRRRLRLDVRRRLRRHQPRLHDAGRRVLGPPGQHPRVLDDRRHADGARWATPTPPAGQYTQLFANEDDPADALVDTLTPGALPTPVHAGGARRGPGPPRLVAERPRAGTPVTIEGNYFNTAATPQVFFGGVAATNVHVNWDGELTADAPADPGGHGEDQVVVTVSTVGRLLQRRPGPPRSTSSPTPRRRPRHRWRPCPSTATGWSAPTAASSPSARRSSTAPRASLHLQRPVVGITPTADRGGYWLCLRRRASSPSATPASTAPSRAAASTRPARACRTA